MRTDSKPIKKTYVVAITILGVLLIGGISFLLFGKDILLNKEDNTISEEIENEQLLAQDLNTLVEEAKEVEFTEFFGYDSLDINKDNPTITLRNSSNNKVLLQYEVFNNDSSIFKSEMLKPGDITKVNVYELLDKGEHTLEYHISSYDQLTQGLLTSDIIQKQKIVIS